MEGHRTTKRAPLRGPFFLPHFELSSAWLRNWIDGVVPLCPGSYFNGRAVMYGKIVRYGQEKPPGGPNMIVQNLCGKANIFVGKVVFLQLKNCLFPVGNLK